MPLLLTDLLRECHRLRKHLRDLQAEIERGPRILKARQEGLEAERLEHAHHHESITKLKLKQRDDEGTLKQTDTRLKKLEEQLTSIANKKEYDAKLSEIAQAKAKKGVLEDAILEVMTEIEDKTAAIPAVEKKWADAQAGFVQYQQDAAERLERLKADQDDSRATLEKTEDQLPADVRSRYDFLVKAQGPEAFALVKDRVCQSCRTRLTDQREIEVRGGSFFLCSTCGKMLYAEK